MDGTPLSFDALLSTLAKMQGVMADARAGRISRALAIDELQEQIDATQRVAAAMTPDERAAFPDLSDAQVRDLSVRSAVPERKVQNLLNRFAQTRGWRPRP